MGPTPPHLKALEEIERGGIPGLVEVLREEGTDGVRYALWDATGWHRDYSPPARRIRATEQQKKIGWEMAEFSPGGRYNAYSGACRACAKIAAAFQSKVPNSVT
jgi:hypothetical protein